MEKNNNEFDTLTIFVKKIKAKAIIKDYENFGWSLKYESENNQYEDIVDLTFERKHKIKNKDELQLLQVYMEDKLNELGKLEKNKNPKTTALGLFFGVVGLILLVFGSLFAFNIIINIALTPSIIMMCIGSIFLVSTFIFIPKLNKKELDQFNLRHMQLNDELKEINNKAASIIGGNNDE